MCMCGNRSIACICRWCYGRNGLPRIVNEAEIYLLWKKCAGALRFLLHKLYEDKNRA